MRLWFRSGRYLPSTDNMLAGIEVLKAGKLTSLSLLMRFVMFTILNDSHVSYVQDVQDRSSHQVADVVLNIKIKVWR